MRPEILEYIENQRVGVLAVEMLDGSPHASTVHYAAVTGVANVSGKPKAANTAEPLVFYFETNKEYRKAEPLFGRPLTRASFVVGTTEAEMKTLQLDGSVEVIKPEEMAAFETVYFGKFPEKKNKFEDAKLVLFKFTPNWWRFTDWRHTEGKKIWLSTDKL